MANVKKRNEMISVMKSWLGKNRSDGSFMEIINEYNRKGPFPRNVKMDPKWHWCACTLSAAAKKLGYVDIIPIEISCYYMIEAAKKMGIWVENDAYIPIKGDIVLYDWDDNGIGDCTGGPEHVGLVSYVNAKSGYFTVIEGNYNNVVKTRTMLINGKFIRGFITPKYDCDGETTMEPTSKKSSSTIAREIIIGLWGNSDEAKNKIISLGYNYDEIQNAINKALNDIDNNKILISTCKPKEQDEDALSGRYIVTEDIYCRNDAGKNKKALTKFNKGLEINCPHGKYTIYNSIKWLYVTGMVGDMKYRGFCNSKYLKRVVD